MGQTHGMGEIIGKVVDSREGIVMHRHTHFQILSLLLGMTAASASLHADELLGDPIAGHRLAKDVCSACHVVAPGREAPSDVDAPAFPELAKDPGLTAISLRVFLQTPHERMPDLRLERDETDDVIAYVLSLDG